MLDLVFAGGVLVAIAGVFQAATRRDRRRATAVSLLREGMSGFEGADAEAFRTLNEAWITRFFALEDEDRRYLGDPVGHVVEPGGAVLVARLTPEHPDGGETVIGCVGLAPAGPGEYELVKMAVSPEHQGHGTGRRLIAAALDRARELGARRVVLESNSQLASAVQGASEERP